MAKKSDTHRLVVPSAFLPVLRAEQTTTTRFRDKLALSKAGEVSTGVGQNEESNAFWDAYLTISFAILKKKKGQNVSFIRNWYKVKVIPSHGLLNAISRVQAAMSQGKALTLPGNLPTLVPPNFCTTQPSDGELQCAKLPMAARVL